MAGRVFKHTQSWVAQRLTWMLGARIILTMLVLGLALSIMGVEGQISQEAYDGLYRTVAVAFSLTAIYAAAFRYVQRYRVFALLQIVTDLLIVSSLVHFSGGHDSFFGFMYLPITIFGAILFPRIGAMGVALASATTYGVLLLLEKQGVIADFAVGSSPPLSALAFAWAGNAGAIFLVAFLTNHLVRELTQTGDALAQRTSDLLHLEDIHARTVESLSSGLLTTDLQGHILSFNREAERITQISVEKAMGCHLDQVIPGSSAEMLLPLDAVAGKRSRTRIEFIDTHGERRYLGLASSILRNEEGMASGYVVIFQDVTRIVELEEAVRLRDRLAALGGFATDIAHEVRNPLAAISGSLEMLRSNLSDEATDLEQRRLMDIVLRETDRLNALISDFLEYARPAQARVAPTVIAEVVTEVQALFRNTAHPGTEIVCAVPEAFSILVDKAQFRQVLWNLVINAQQAMPDGGIVRIVAEEVEGKQVAEALRDLDGPIVPPVSDANALQVTKATQENFIRISVSDTGIGIAPELRKRAFDPFFTTKKKGSGLGLAIVHRIVEANGGRVRLQSELGQGTKVELWFRRA